jgi:hypothetical protein
MNIREYLAGGLIHCVGGRNVRFAHRRSFVHITFVIERLYVQGSSSPLALSAVIAANDLVSYIIYEVIQEALCEVCMRLPTACCSPYLTLAMLLFLSRLAACCSSNLRNTTFALLHLTSFLLFPLRSGALGC